MIYPKKEPQLKIVAFTVLMALGIVIYSSSNVFAVVATERPVIETIEVRKISGGKAEIFWATNIPAQGIVELYKGTKIIERFRPPGNETTKEHAMLLTNLSPSTNYDIIIKAHLSGVNDPAYIAESSKVTFKTGSKSEFAGEPEIKKINFYFRTGTTVSLTWETTEPSTGKIYYAKTLVNAAAEKLSNVKLAGNEATFHDVTVSGLKPGSAYNYKIVSSDKSGNTFETDVLTFFTDTTDELEKETLEITKIKPIDTNDPLVGYASTQISWSTNLASKGVVRYGIGNSTSYRRETSSPRATDHSIKLDGLTPNKTYSYTITATDVLGRSKTSQIFRFTTKQAPTGYLPTKQKSGSVKTVTGIKIPIPGLVKTSVKSNVWKIFSNGQKLPLINDKALNSYAETKTMNITTVGSDILDKIPNVLLVKTSTRPFIYMIDNGTKRFIKNENVFKAHGWSFDDVIVITENHLRALPTGKTLTK